MIYLILLFLILSIFIFKNYYIILINDTVVKHHRNINVGCGYSKVINLNLNLNAKRSWHA